MKHYSLLTKSTISCAVAFSCTFGVLSDRASAQGRSLTPRQIEAIVKPTLAQCAPPSNPLLKSGQPKSSRIDPASVIPTRNAREFPRARIAKSLHGMWRGQVYGDYRETRVDYFWIIDMQNNEGLIIAQRTGNDSMAGLQPVKNAPKITYLMCANEGYIPSSEGGSQIHEFVKVADGIEDAPRILQNATGVKFTKAQPTLSELWQEIVSSGYFVSLPAIAFAGGLFKPMQLNIVPGPMGPPQVSLRWDGEYYGGGATLLKFTPGVPIRGVEYVQFLGTSALTGDFLVASPGNGNLYKVEALVGADYDLAFDAVTFGPLQ